MREMLGSGRLQNLSAIDREESIKTEERLERGFKKIEQEQAQSELEI